jgi:hypothetical protein
MFLWGYAVINADVILPIDMAGIGVRDRAS